MYIHLYPHPILSYVCKPLKKVDEFIVQVVDKMRELMEQHDGIGLSAPQVGLPYSFFITNLKVCPVVINPVVYGNGGLGIATEGCLSIPDLTVKVRRNNKIRLNGYDLEGNEINLRLEGLFARVCLHEYHHLKGELIINKPITTTIEEKNKIIERLSELELEFQQEDFNKEEWMKNIQILEESRC
jgi:peptide deformylase